MNTLNYSQEYFHMMHHLNERDNVLPKSRGSVVKFVEVMG